MMFIEKFYKNRCFQFKCKIVWFKRFINKELWKFTDVEKFATTVKQRKWKYIKYTVESYYNKAGLKKILRGTCSPNWDDWSNVYEGI